VPVDVVAAPGVTQTLRSNPALKGLKLRTVSDESAARKDIRNGDAFAAYVPQGNGLLVSSAHGAVATHTIEGMFTAVAASTGAQLQLTDVRPVSKQDPNGVSVFYLIFGVTLGAFLCGQGSFAVARGLPARMKIGQALLFSVLLGVVASLVTRVWIGVLPGSVIAETGVLILLASAVSLFTIAVTTIAGDPGVPVATIIALILGTGVSGGPIPSEFIPSGFAFFTSAVAPGAAVETLRDIAYFDSGKVVGPLLVMAAWVVVSLAVIVAVPMLRGRSAQAPAASNTAAPSAVS
jgi:hypothetical protein